MISLGEDKDKSKVETFKFTRVVFGLNQSPFILGANIEKHLKSKEKDFPREVEEIRQSIYVDDLLLSENTNSEMQILKETTIKIFNEGTFELHKRHSSESDLEKEAGLNDSAE